MLDLNKIYLGDCLEVMKDIDNKSIDCIFTDLPYQITSCKWDIIIPFKELWEHYERIIKEHGAIILFGKQPFTSALIMSNLKLFKYSLVWDKVNSSSGLHAKTEPLRSHEDINVFGKGKITYNPQMTEAKIRVDKERIIANGEAFNGGSSKRIYDNKGLKYPKSILTFTNAYQHGKIHPTQKNIKLCEYIVQTYSNIGETVLDNCTGSATIPVACINTNRNYIGIEKDEKYYKLACERIDNIKVS